MRLSIQKDVNQMKPIHTGWGKSEKALGGALNVDLQADVAKRGVCSDIGLAPC